MKREVLDTPIQAIGLPPDDFHEQAQRAIALIPDEFDAVYVGPAFLWAPIEDDASWPEEYLGADWMIVKDEKFVRWLTERPQDMLDPTVQAAYLREARHCLKLTPKVAPK